MLSSVSSVQFAMAFAHPAPDRPYRATITSLITTWVQIVVIDEAVIDQVSFCAAKYRPRQVNCDGSEGGRTEARAGE